MGPMGAAMGAAMGEDATAAAAEELEEEEEEEGEGDEEEELTVLSAASTGDHQSLQLLLKEVRHNQGQRFGTRV